MGIAGPLICGRRMAVERVVGGGSMMDAEWARHPLNIVRTRRFVQLWELRLSVGRDIGFGFED